MTKFCQIFLITLITGTAAQAASPILDTLYQFTGGNDGSTPIAPVTISGGVIYGTTTFGGPSGLGTVFSLTPPATAAGAWTETVLHTFTAREGFSPFGTVVAGPNGVLYGTTYLGGPSRSGTVFSLRPPASPSGAWTETTLHAFSGTMAGGSIDGGNPSAPLVIGKGGVLFGTTAYGGTHGVGTAFALIPPASAGASWTETVLHNFGSTQFDGTDPIAGLVIGRDGKLYGTTYTGGRSDAGTIFSLKPPASPGGVWTETVLYSFSGGNDGGAPYFGSLVMDGAGVLYGTTETGGTQLTGTIFSLTPPAAPGGAWTEAVLHNFIARSGKLPLGGLAMDAAGNLFGTTSSGGAHDAGTAFRVTPQGGSWTYTVLHDFTFNGSNGEVPYAGLVLGPGGLLFGTTSGLNPFGTGNGGTVFVLRP